MSPRFSPQNRASKGDQIARWIALTDAQDPGTKVISSAVRPTRQIADARILFRLGLGLGLAYAAFLVAWFWTTRNRTHGVARVVRF